MSYPYPYPPVSPGGYATSAPSWGRWRKILLAAAVLVAGFVALATIGALLAPSTPQHNELTGDTATSIPGVVNGAPAADGTSWPADLAPFTAFIGSGPSAHDAWNSAQCASTSLGAAGELHTVTCLEPDDTSVFVTSFSNPTDLNELLASDMQDGGTTSTWTVDGRGLGTAVTNTANGDTTVANTFDKYPTVLVTMQGADASTVEADWRNAPLPH